MVLKIIIRLTDRDTIKDYPDDSVLVRDFLTDPDMFLELDGTSVKIDRGGDSDGIAYYNSA